MTADQQRHAVNFLRDVACDIFPTHPLQANGLANLADALDPIPNTYRELLT